MDESYKDKLDEWVTDGLSRGLLYLLVMQDLVDKEYFPVYFQFYIDAQAYQNKIISESKLKVIELIRMTNYSSAK